MEKIEFTEYGKLFARSVYLLELESLTDELCKIRARSDEVLNQANEIEPGDPEKLHTLIGLMFEEEDLLKRGFEIADRCAEIKSELKKLDS